MTQQPPGWDPYRQSQGAPQPYGADPYGQTSYGQSYGQPAPYGEVVPYQQPAPAPVYQPQPMWANPAPPKTSGLAVASMVCALVGVVFWYFAFILEILALVFGIIAKRQVKERGLRGGGMATAGIVIACILMGIEVVVVLGWILLFGGLIGAGTLTGH